MKVEITAANCIREFYGRNRLAMTSQHNAIIKRVINGLLNPISVKHARQNIIEGAMKTSSVVEQVERQLTVWKNLGVAISDKQWENILRQADAFDPVTDSDEPLVTGGFGYTHPNVVAGKLFEAFTPPDGYTKFNYIEDAELRYARRMKPTGRLRLVHYDPNAYAGLSTQAALKAAKQNKLRLAGIEVLEHLVLNPQASLTWDGKLYFFPILSGLQRKYYNTGWPFVPCIYRWDDSHGFMLYSGLPSSTDHNFSSPVVREC
jgi:hypothetical protein